MLRINIFLLILVTSHFLWMLSCAAAPQALLPGQRWQSLPCRAPGLLRSQQAGCAQLGAWGSPSQQAQRISAGQQSQRGPSLGQLGSGHGHCPSFPRAAWARQCPSPACADPCQCSVGLPEARMFQQKPASGSPFRPLMQFLQSE